MPCHVKLGKRVAVRHSFSFDTFYVFISRGACRFREYRLYGCAALPRNEAHRAFKLVGPLSTQLHCVCLTFFFPKPKTFKLCPGKLLLSFFSLLDNI